VHIATATQEVVIRKTDEIFFMISIVLLKNINIISFYMNILRTDIYIYILKQSLFLY
jgi:hypothetical protein